LTTIGLIGAGKLAPRMIRSLLDDQLEAHDDLRLLVPVTKKHLTDEIDIAVAWAEKKGVPVDALVDGTADDLLDEMEVDQGTTAKKGKVPTTLAKAVAESEGRLFVLWDDSDEDAYLAFETAFEAGVKCFDMVNGLEEMTFDDADEEPPAEEESEAESTPEEPEPEEAPDKPEGEGLDTRAEMMRMTVPELKKMLKARGVTLNRSGKGRIARGAYVDAILKHDETGATVFMQDGATAVPIDEDEVAQANDEDVPAADEEPQDAPESDEEPVEVPEDEEAAESAPAAAEGSTPSAGFFVSEGTTTSTGSFQGGHTLVTSNVAAPAPTRALLTGTCTGCGGPIFALDGDDDWPEVLFFHAEGCEAK
jgi:hypothetical protein